MTNVFVVMTGEPDARLIAVYTNEKRALMHAREGIAHQDYPARRVSLYVEEVPLNPSRIKATA